MRFSAHAGTFIICCAVALLGTFVYQRVASPALHFHLDAPQTAADANHDHPPLDPEDAKTLGALMETMRVKPDDAALSLSIAEIFIRNKDWVNAASFLEKTVELTPKTHRPLHLLGFTRSQLGQYAQAAEAFEKAVAVSPEPQSVFSLGIMYRYHLNKPENALELFTAAAASPKSDAALRDQAQREISALREKQ